MNRITNNLNKLADLIVAMPVPPPEKPAGSVRDAWGTANAAAPPAAPPAAPAAPALALFQMEILDVDAMREIDPILPPRPVVRLDAAWTEPVTVTREGHDLFRLTPTDAGQEATSLMGPLYWAIVDALGDDAMPEPSSDFIAEGEAWARPALIETPHGALPGWRDEPRAHMEMVASRLVRSWRLPPGEVERIVGIAPPARGLYPVGRDYDRLAELRRAAEERKRATAEAAAAAVQVEIRDLTFAQMGIAVVAVKIGRLADGLVSARASAPSHQWQTAAPWPGARVLFASDTEVFYGHRVVPGCSLPMFSRDGVRSVDPSTIAPRALGEVVEADAHAMAFLGDRKRENGENMGPVRDLQAQVWPAAAELIGKSVRVLLSPSPMQSHRLQLLAEQLVRTRDCQLRPDAACNAILGHPDLDGRFRALRPPVEIPYGAIVRSIQTGEQRPLPKREVQSFADHELPSKALLGPLGQALVRAVSIGSYVPAGSKLLAEPWPSLDAPSPAPMESEKASEESTSATAKRKSR